MILLISHYNLIFRQEGAAVTWVATMKVTAESNAVVGLRVEIESVGRVD